MSVEESKAGSSCEKKPRKAGAVSLPVIGVTTGGVGSAADGGGAKGSKPRSTMGKLRALVLIGVHLLIALHITLWLMSGMSDGERSTLSPVEPSEAMFTLELGTVNAGFVLFLTAIASTLIFGRWFCGWACHVVALQDFCGWLMKKVGVHPKPWRTRLLLWAPTVLALYMFVWPTFRREIVARVFGEAVTVDGKTRHVLSPELSAWLGEVRPWPAEGFEPRFVVENFWETFAPWYMAVPFLFVCGFVAVYFLGAKGFCTYGCPYGGFFSPVDRLSPVRIKVNDSCNQCGHCTAVCTSNVRVSEEVRDYGAVVDPGCMKCLDCVSACPNDALSVGLTKPAVMIKPRVGDAELSKSKAKLKSRYDLSLGEEVVLSVLMLVLTTGYRGLYGLVPLLMAVGMAGVVTFMVYKCWRLVRDANVRGPFWQLKRTGRLTGAGAVFAVATLVLTGMAVQGALISIGRWTGNPLYDRVMSDATVTKEALLSKGYTPTAEVRELAKKAEARIGRGLSFAEGGMNVLTPPLVHAKVFWLRLVQGDLEGAEGHMRQKLAGIATSADVILLAQTMQARGAKDSEIEGMIEGMIKATPELEDARRLLAERYVMTNRVAEATRLYREAQVAVPRDIATLRGAIRFAMNLDNKEAALATADRAVKEYPESTVLLMDLANVLVASQQMPAGVAMAQRVSALDPQMPAPYFLRADVLESQGKAEEAKALRAKGEQLEEQAQRQRERSRPASLPSPTGAPE